VICFLAKSRQKATLPPKSGENGLFSEKQIAQSETVLELFGESVATGLPAVLMAKSLNCRHLCRILTWDSRQPRYTAHLKKTSLGLVSFEVEQFN
jgi:hypothetical protein